MSTKDPLVTKWRPPEVGAESTKLALEPARAPPKVKRCIFGRFWPIPPPLRPNAIFLFLGLWYQFFFYFRAKNKKNKIKQKNPRKCHFSPNYSGLTKLFKKSPKIGIFLRFALISSKCHFFVFYFFLLRLKKQLKINTNFHSVKKKSTF